MARQRARRLRPHRPYEHERPYWFSNRPHHLLPGTVTIDKAGYVCDVDRKKFRRQAEFIAHVRLVHHVPVDQIPDLVVLTEGQVTTRENERPVGVEGLTDLSLRSTLTQRVRTRKEEFPMADPITFPRSLDDVRAQVQRIRTEGEKLVDRIRTDAKDLIARAPKVASIDEARKRAEQAVKTVQDLRSRRSELLEKLVSQIITNLGLARAEQVAKLETRLADLERRVEALPKATEQAA